MKIYTKTGDDGTTGLFGGARVAKASERVEAYGTVDELNALLGVVRQRGVSTIAEVALSTIQPELFVLGAELATAPGKEDKLARSMPLLDADASARLERWIDQAEEGLPPLTSFVLPGGSESATYMHLARTVCRRAERRVLVIDEPKARGELVIYLNRLSDLLFVLARRENHERGVADVPWAPRKS